MALQDEIARWSLGGDTGSSSKAIAARNLGMATRDRFARPYDSDDFGRCYRMLKACPSASIKRMAGLSGEWDALVLAWDKLTLAYEQDAENYQNGERSGLFGEALRQALRTIQ